MAIPSRVSGTLETLSSNAGGIIAPTNVWSNPEIGGLYDIVIDVNGNGEYNELIDALDDGDIEVSAGVQIIPELVPAIIFIAFVTITLMMTFLAKLKGNSTKKVKLY